MLFWVRLVDRDLVQISGKIFNEIYSPVATLNTVLTVAAKPAGLNQHMHKLEVEIAFQDDNLKEEIFFFVQPLVFFFLGFINQFTDSIITALLEFNQILWEKWCFNSSSERLRVQPGTFCSLTHSKGSPKCLQLRRILKGSSFSSKERCKILHHVLSHEA